MYGFASSFHSASEWHPLIFKVAVKKANVGGPVKPAVNSILLEVGQVNRARSHHTTSHMGMAAAVRPALMEELAHPPTPARIKAAAATANTLILRIGILLFMPWSVAVRPERGAQRKVRHGAQSSAAPIEMH